jgi:hypothetical protein
MVILVDADSGARSLKRHVTSFLNATKGEQ